VVNKERLENILSGFDLPVGDASHSALPFVLSEVQSLLDQKLQSEGFVTALLLIWLSS